MFNKKEVVNVERICTKKKSGKKNILEQKSFFVKNKLLMASMTLVGTIIGAGILGIPYVVAKVGLLLGLIVVVLVGLIFLFVNLLVGEFILRTNEQHQLTGYADKYLGKWGKYGMTLAMMISIYGALTAYLIGEGQTFYSILNFGNPLMFSLIFFVITFLIICRGIKATGKAEIVLVSLLFFVVILTGILSLNKINYNYFNLFNPIHLLLVYGVVVFSFMGSPAIPEMHEELGKNKKLLKKSILIGSLTPILIYLLFCFFVVGVVGLNNFELLTPNERIATIALSVYTSPLLGLFANFIAILAMFTSYLTLAMALIGVYKYDYGFSKVKSFLLTLTLPLIIVIFDLTNFIAVLGLTGVFSGGLEGTLLVLTFWKAKLLGDRKPEYSLNKNYFLGTLLIIIFLTGIIFSLI